MKIKDIGKVITGKTPCTKNIDNFEGAINFITPEDIAKGYIVKTTNRHISEKGYDSIKSNTLNGISILVGCIGSDMGNVAISEGKCASNQQINAITDIADAWNPFYIYYYLSKKKRYFHQIAGTTTTPILPKSVFEEIDIPYIRKDLQDKIANTLKALDDKIENNNRIIEELESMAKTIYDYWFLQFEFPNKEGKPYQSSGGKMVWNGELQREIPEGWRVGNLYDIAEFVNGLACQKYRPIDQSRKLPVIKIKEMHEGITSNTEYVIDDILEKNIINDGDILFSWSATLEVMIWTGGKGALNQHIFKVIPKEYEKYYVYMQLSAYIINFIHMAEARKTTMGHITIDHLKQSRIAFPPKEIAEIYNEKVGGVFDKIICSNRQNRELVLFRDFLLPLLMNGQVGFKKREVQYADTICTKL
ncbi:restriction endonuclease subunit S [Lachnospiraceae bacterium 62-35]